MIQTTIMANSELWAVYGEDEEKGLYIPLDEFDIAQRNFLRAPGPETFPHLRKVYRVRYHDTWLAQLVASLEEHSEKLPKPWSHLAFAELYEQSWRLAEAQYELEKWFDIVHDYPNEVYDLYVRILLRRKRWQAALKVLNQWQKTILKSETKWNGIVRFHFACAATLGGDTASALANLDAAESFGFKDLKVKLLRLQVLVEYTKDFRTQLKALDEVKGTMPIDNSAAKKVKRLDCVCQDIVTRQRLW